MPSLVRANVDISTPVDRSSPSSQLIRNQAATSQILLIHTFLDMCPLIGSGTCVAAVRSCKFQRAMKRFEWNRRRHPARHARPGWVAGALIDKNAPIREATTPQTMKGLRMTGSPPKAVIVTTASCGIGRAAALRLARDGFAVVAN